MYTYAYVQDNNNICLSCRMCTYGIEYNILYNQMLIVLD